MSQVSAPHVPTERSLVPIPGPRGRARLAAVAAFRSFDPRVYTRLHQAHGDIVSLALPRAPVLLFHPDQARQVLRTEAARFSKGQTLEPFRRLLGNGLLLAEGDSWFRQRRTVAPELAATRLETFLPRIAHNTDELLEHWRASARAQASREVAEDMIGLAFRNSGEILLGEDLSGELAAVGKLTTQGARITMRRFGALFRFPVWVPTPDNLRRRRLDRMVDSMVYGVLDRHQQRLAPAAEAPAAEATGDNATTPCLLARLLAARDPETGEAMDRQQVRDEVVTLLMASFDTTGMALAWSLHLLSRHAEIADRVAAEAREFLDGDVPTLSAVESLTYTRQVLHEAMRLYPPILGLLRTATEPVQLGPHTVAAGDNVLVASYQIHRHPTFWPDPERFDPDRFGPAAAKTNAAARTNGKREPYAYLPFGRGNRACVGEKLALLEATAVLAKIARAFHLRPAPGPEIVPRHLVILRPENGIPLHMTPRQITPGRR